MIDRIIRRIRRNLVLHRTKSDTELQQGAPVMVFRCVEPALSTSDAVRMLEEFMIDNLTNVEIDTSQGLLFDTVALPGIVRNIASDTKIVSNVVEWCLKLLIDAHGTEVIFVVEHTHCAERASAYNTQLNAIQEARDILHNLKKFAEKIEKMMDGKADRLVIIPVIAYVSNFHDSRRRVIEYISLPEFRKRSGLLVNAA